MRRKPGGHRDPPLQNNNNTLQNPKTNGDNMKKHKIIFSILIILGISIVIYCVIPDYMATKEIPKGYTNSEKFNNTAQDIDIRKIYYYPDNSKDLFKKNGIYKQISENDVYIIKQHLSWFDESKKTENITQKISKDDYFILRYLNNSADEINYYNGYFEIYYFDTGTNTLYYFLFSE